MTGPVAELTECLPFGLLCLDGTAVASMNASARDLLGRLDPEASWIVPQPLSELLERLTCGTAPSAPVGPWCDAVCHGRDAPPLTIDRDWSLVYRLSVLRRDAAAWLLIEDVTAQAEQERLLGELETFVNGGAWGIDTASGALFLSDGVWTLFGDDARDKLGHIDGWLAYVEESRRESLRAYMAKCVAEKLPYEAIYPVDLPDGRHMMISARGRVVPGEQGRAARAVGIFRDVTDEHRQQNALDDSERRFRAILDTVADIVIVQRGEHLEFVSQSVTDVLGYEPARLIGRNALEFVHPDEVAAVEERFQDSAGDARRVVSTECRLRHADGTWRRIQVAGRRAAGDDPDRPLVIVCRDVTELREAQERLRQGEKLEALGRLAGGVAHDFNNLLTAIIGNCELIELEAVEGTSFALKARQIREAGLRASELTRQMLTFARRSEPTHKPVNLNATIAEAASMLGRSLDRRFRVETDLLAEAPWVQGDAGMIHAALLNLGLNARDAMAERGGTIVMRSRRVEAPPALDPAGGLCVAIEVADSGLGIEPSLLERIFEPCFTTKPVGQGTGLGLASVQGCALSHGGLVQVDSAPGAGATFRLLLPAAPVPRDVAAQGARGIAAGRRRHVVVVDDQDDVQTVISAALTRAGLSVTCFSDGRSALRWFGEQHPGVDLVLLDMSMPGLSGAQTFEALRQVDPGIRVLVTSGYAFDDAPEDLVEQGAIGFVGKPFRLTELVERVQQALQG